MHSQQHCTVRVTAGPASSPVSPAGSSNCRQPCLLFLSCFDAVVTPDRAAPQGSVAESGR